MNAAYRLRLERNIVKFAWYKIFTKRVYLPLIVIHLANVGGVTVGQLALIAGITSVAQLLLQLPTGYFADRWGNRRAVITGTLIAATSPLFYVWMPNFWGGLIASLLFFGGYAFQSGAIEAFMHDTLIALGKADQYAGIMGRAQSYGLVGSVILLATIPATYAIDRNLPFYLGFLSLLGMAGLAYSFTFPPSRFSQQPKNPLAAVRTVVTRQNIALFLFAGLALGIGHKGQEFRELLFQDVGIAAAWFGLILALSSLVGALLGLCLHLADRLSALSFYFWDIVIMSVLFAIGGLSRQPLVVAGAFILSMGYIRVRLILYQSKLLKGVDHAYKASLLSALGFFTILAEIGVIALLARLIGWQGYSAGYVLFAAASFGSGLLLWLILAAEHRRTLNPAS